jgi:hypothetical protein
LALGDHRAPIGVVESRRLGRGEEFGDRRRKVGRVFEVGEVRRAGQRLKA